MISALISPTQVVVESEPALLLLCGVFVPADIQAGQGLYYTTLTKSWRAKNCTVNAYGVSNQTFGLSPAPCRECESAILLGRRFLFQHTYTTNM